MARFIKTGNGLLYIIQHPFACEDIYFIKNGKLYIKHKDKIKKIKFP